MKKDIIDKLHSNDLEVSSFIGSIAKKEKHFIDILLSTLSREEQVDIGYTDFVLNGLYVREIFIPKGTFMIGSMHNKDFTEIISKGSVLMFSGSDNGQVLSAPLTRTYKANERKCGYSLEDTVWTTFHSVDSSNIEDARNECIDSTNIYVDMCRASYKELLEELGIDEEYVKNEMNEYGDTIEDTSGKVRLDNSDIEGTGVIANYAIKEGSNIGYGLIDNNKTILGRYTNHSMSPNCVFSNEKDGFISMIALRNIMRNEELTVDYRKTIYGDKKCQQ